VPERRRLTADQIREEQGTGPPDGVARANVGVGSRFSFVYPKGERSHCRRTVRLRKWLVDDVFECHDEGAGDTRKYHADKTTYAVYLESERYPSQDGGRRPISDTPAGAAEALAQGPEAAGLRATCVTVAAQRYWTDNAQLASMPLAVHKINPEIKNFELATIGKARRSIWVKQYCFDHGDCCSLLVNSLRDHGIEIRFILDYNQFYEPSCRRQTRKLYELMAHADMHAKTPTGGCLELRTLKMQGGMYATQHSKTWLLDGVYYLGGSGNMTHNSEVNFEEVIGTSLKPIVEGARNSFLAAWGAAETVHIHELEAMLKRHRSAEASRSVSTAEESAERSSKYAQSSDGSFARWAGTAASSKGHPRDAGRQP